MQLPGTVFDLVHGGISVERVVVVIGKVGGGTMPVGGEAV
jgi:hypothetical protein